MEEENPIQLEALYLQRGETEGELQKETRTSAYKTLQEMDLTKTEKKKKFYITIFRLLFILVLLVFIWGFLNMILIVWVQFYDMIGDIDASIKYRKGVPDADKLQYYNHTSGYTIAFYNRFPHLPTNPFNNISFPQAVVQSYYTKDLSDLFFPGQGTDNPDLNVLSQNLQWMYVYSAVGDISQGSHEPNAIQIICNTYANQQQVCEKTCLKYPTMGPGSIVASGLGMGLIGGFAAHGVIGGAAEAGMNTATAYTMAGGLVVFSIGLGLGVAFMSNRETEEIEQSQTNCKT